ncbi:MAG: alpha/beta hydrolase [Kangiellaceae bacterium]|nr:alpha/beta hydrolase [Kangiellaceae bacterium]MCW8998201.1 alpha/beta hydrolase [Kangiellaceae bacterium]
MNIKPYENRVILLRGLGRDQKHWKPLVKKLNFLCPQTKIETPDLPGAGKLYQSESPLKLGQYISSMEKQLCQSDLPTLLIGLSLGGMIALEWASRFPNKFSRLVLINSSSRLNPFYQRLNLLNASLHPRTIIGLSLREQETSIYKLTCNSRPVDQQVIARWIGIQREHPVSLKNQIRQIAAGARFKLPFKDQMPPVHVVYSRADRLVSPKCSQALIKYFSATSDIHHWGGHDLPQDDPEWIAEVIKDQISLSRERTQRDSNIE